MSVAGTIVRAAAVVRTVTLALLCCSAAVVAQPCPAPENSGPQTPGWRTVTVTRGTRSMSCRVTYPAVTAAQNAALDTSRRPYPMIAFGHGFAMQNSYYTSYYEHLASHGYIVIAPQFPDTQHGELALDLLQCIDYLRQQHTTPSSFLAGSVDTSRAGVSGHSMGGGASLLAASYDTRVRVAAPMTAAETTPSAIARMQQITGAVVLIAGSADGVTPPAQHQTPMYNAARPFRSLAMLQGGNHTRCMDVALFDWTDPGGSMSRADQQLLTRRFMTAAFHLFLKDDPCGWNWSYGAEASGDPRAVLSKETTNMTPLPFSLVSPLAGTPASPVVLTWRRARSLNPGDTVRYTVQIAGSRTFSPVLRDIPASDTTLLLTDHPTDPPQLHWRVLARTSPSTIRVSDNYGVFAWFIPVELEAFTATTAGGLVHLRWITASESGTHGFVIERSIDGTRFSDAGFVTAAGNSTQRREYAYADQPGAARVWYRLRIVDFDGTSMLSRTLAVDAAVPAAIALSHYPEPARLDAVVTMDVAEEGRVSLMLHDVLGRPVLTLHDGWLPAGRHAVSAAFAGLPRGTYWLALRSGAGAPLLRRVVLQ